MTWASLLISNHSLQHKCSPPSSSSLKFDLHSTVMERIQGHSDSRAPSGEAGNRTESLYFPVLHVHQKSTPSALCVTEMPHPSLRSGNVHSFTHKQGTLPAASQPADFDCIKLFQSRFSS